jgi:ATP-dependent RNA helicase DeaD
MDLPSNRSINKQRVARFHERITEGLAHKEIETFQAIVDHYQREHTDVPMERIAAALALLANEGVPLLVKDELKQTSFAADGGREISDNRAGGKKREFSSDRRPGTRRSDAGMETFRIEVGRNHQVQPGNIVGAIANEAGIGSESIGKIKIFDQFSTVDLPEGLPRSVLDAIDNVVIAGRKLRLSRMDDARPRPARAQDGKRPFNKAKAKPKYRKNQSSDR